MARYAKHITTRGGQRTVHIPSLCNDCAIEVMPDTPPGTNDWQWYMVTDTVWAATGVGDGYLCIPCLETRLGRELTGADLKPELPVNQPDFYEDTPRLAELKQQSVEHWRNTRMTENTTHWRELTNELTASQIDTLERAEKLGNCTADLLLDVARECVTDNIAETAFADVAAPAGAEKVYRWVDDGDGVYVRFCTLHRAEVAGGRVEVAAMQQSDGHTENFIVVHDIEQLDADEARGLAAALMVAADKLAPADQSHPLDRFSTEEIRAEIRRRPGGAEALRALLGDELDRLNGDAPPFM
jgi:hypothetical protein